MKYKCPCCGYYTFENRPDGSFEICEVCFWEDDPIQNKKPRYRGGANRVSLNRARKNFKKYGACHPSLIPFVRTPYREELSGLDE